MTYRGLKFWENVQKHFMAKLLQLFDILKPGLSNSLSIGQTFDTFFGPFIFKVHRMVEPGMSLNLLVYQISIICFGLSIFRWIDL